MRPPTPSPLPPAAYRRSPRIGHAWPGLSVPTSGWRSGGALFERRNHPAAVALEEAAREIGALNMPASEGRARTWLALATHAADQGRWAVNSTGLRTSRDTLSSEIPATTTPRWSSASGTCGGDKRTRRSTPGKSPGRCCRSFVATTATSPSPAPCPSATGEREAWAVGSRGREASARRRKRISPRSKVVPAGDVVPQEAKP